MKTPGMTYLPSNSDNDNADANTSWIDLSAVDQRFVWVSTDGDSDVTTNATADAAGKIDESS